MQKSPLDEQRQDESRTGAYGLIDDKLVPMQRSNTYGKLAVELELQDGIVMFVRFTREEETKRVKSAA